MSHPTIAPAWIARVTPCENAGEFVLIDVLELIEYLKDAQRHLRVVRVAPRGGWRGARRKNPIVIRMAEELFAKAIADRKSRERQTGTFHSDLMCIHRLLP